jgi:hypothetical protein
LGETAEVLAIPHSTHISWLNRNQKYIIRGIDVLLTDSPNPAPSLPAAAWRRGNPSKCQALLDGLLRRKRYSQRGLVSGDIF